MMFGFNVFFMFVGLFLEGIEKGLVNMVKVFNFNNYIVINNSFIENLIV